MSESIEPQQLSTPLRQQAEQQLRTGTAQLSTEFTASAEALGALYRLSSTPTTAAESLKLLHELQTYQVELDLQLEQLQDNERELRHELGCYQHFFDMNPVSCLIANADTKITQCNTAAARLFRHISANVSGRSLLSLFAEPSRPLLNAALTKTLRSGQSATLRVAVASEPTTTAPIAPSNITYTQLRLSISLSPDHNALLIILAEDANCLPAPQQTAAP